MLPPKNADVFSSGISFMWFDEYGILCSVYKKDAVLTPESLDRSFQEIKERSGGKKICWLGEISDLSETSREARDFAAEKTPEFVIALALITTSPLSRMVANLYLTLKKPPYPSRLFTDEQKAREWLKRHM
jgi:hypothetical protein